MTTTIRLFFAVALGDDARAALDAACGALKEKVPFARWTHPADYHATVKFIGDVEPELARRLADPIRDAVAGSGRFELALGAFGAFGRPAAPDILWCGAEGVDPLRALHERVDAAAAGCGVARDTRPFRPHITVARKYRGAAPFAAHADALRLAAPDPHPWTVAELALYRTHFGRRPAYEAIERFPLG